MKTKKLFYLLKKQFSESNITISPSHLSYCHYVPINQIMKSKEPLYTSFEQGDNIVFMFTINNLNIIINIHHLTKELFDKMLSKLSETEKMLIKDVYLFTGMNINKDDIEYYLHIIHDSFLDKMIYFGEVSQKIQVGILNNKFFIMKKSNL